MKINVLELLTLMDDSILKKCQLITNWVANIFNKDCFFIAKIISAIFPTYFFLLLLYKLSFKPELQLTFNLAMFILFVLAIDQYRTIKDSENKFHTEEELPEIVSERSIELQYIRILLLILSFILFIIETTIIKNVDAIFTAQVYSLWYLAIYYFISCTPKPPKKGWFNNKIDKFLALVNKRIQPQKA